MFFSIVIYIYKFVFDSVGIFFLKENRGDILLRFFLNKIIYMDYVLWKRSFLNNILFLFICLEL